MKYFVSELQAVMAGILSLALAVSAQAGTYDVLLGFNNTAAPTVAGQNDYVIDLGLTASTLIATAQTNGGSYTFTNIISASTFSTAFSSDANYLNNVAAGVLAGYAPANLTHTLFQTSTSLAGLRTWTASNLATFNGAVGYAQSPTLGEYASALGLGGNPTTSGGFSQYVAISPTTPGGNAGGSVASTSGNPMQFLSSGVISEAIFESTGTGARGTTPSAWTQVGTFNINVNTHNVTFTLGSSSPAPVISSVSGTVTNGFSPLQVVFTNTATGSITQWVWNFGNGTIITNTTGANVTNTYTSGGDYAITLTVYGPGGSATQTLANYIIASPAPRISQSFAGGLFVLSGTNCPVGVQYRILNSTNVALPLANWQPVFTNTFLNNGSFAYTNTTTNTTGFFQLVSP